MRIAILSGSSSDLSAYVAEILKSWGLVLFEAVQPAVVARLDASDVPVVVCPVSEGVDEDALIGYARRGGTVVCFLPGGGLARAAGLAREGEQEARLRLRVTEAPAAGLAGEGLPVVGRAGVYRPGADVRVLAYLCHPGRYRGEDVGITVAPVGRGRMVVFAFDLALCVLLLRQGDPGRAEVIPPGDGCARASHMAADIGPGDSGWVPFADLLSRLFVDVLRKRLPGPAPLISHLPGTAPGMLLYSGDEDYADVAATDDELDYVRAAGGRMSLYIIPNHTRSTRADVQRYTAHHDVGPHPNLRPLDGRPVAERLLEFERQVRMFEALFGTPARSVRNHCLAWAGYMDLAEVQERLGVRMDANYCCSAYMRNRDFVPYASFGAAMPMRFCRPDGRLIEVFQQHTHLSDDGWFGPAEYSLKFSTQQFEVVLSRIFSDIQTRFHMPYGVIIHPGNWAKFSRGQGEALLRQAAERDMPVWSYDRWLAFWEARDTWRFRRVRWDGRELRFAAEGERPCEGLCFALPETYAGASLTDVRLDGEGQDWQRVSRYGETLGLVSVPAGSAVEVSASYA